MKHVLFLQDLGLERSETVSLLEAAGCEYRPVWAGELDEDEMRENVAVLVTSNHRVDRGVLERWPNLEMVSLGFTGYDDVDLGCCRERGIHVYYVPGYATASVVELTVALALAVLRRIPTADRSVRAGGWDGGDVQPGIELDGKTVGVLGTGTIGMRSARAFEALGCRLIGWSRTRYSSFPGTYMALDDVFRQADVLTLHVPLSDGTRHVVNRDRLELMKPGAILVNTSRAGLVDTEALAEAIRRGDLAGAGIDVFDQESPAAQDDPLVRLCDRHVVVTPHVGFKTKEALDRLARTTVANVGRYLRDEPENRLVP